MNYYDEKEFIVKAKISRSTLYRFYKKNEELKEETKLDYKRTYPESHLKYFSSEVMFDENKILRIENQSMKQENQSMRNLLDCLADKNSLPSKLWHLEWSFFLTVAYKLDRNKKSSYNQMTKLYDYLISKYGNDTTLRLFFTTEPFTDRKGTHNHFLLYVSNKMLHDVIIQEINNCYIYDRIDLKLYNKYKPAVFYIAKNGLVNEDWDLLGNNLKAEGVNYAN